MTLERSLIGHCAPTLAGLKVASLYRYFPRDRRQFARQFRDLREKMAARGLRLRVLKGCGRTGSLLLYLYRAEDLRRTLEDGPVGDYLSACGYDTAAGSEGMLHQMARRVCLRREFPHEIGLFLGYPLEDVEGFIRNKGQGYTCCGHWKSYGDPAEARRRFAGYRACTETYRRRYDGGTPITQLIVAA